MPSYAQQVRDQQTRARGESTLFSPAAGAGQGLYRGRPYCFCLPEEAAAENLWAGMRTAAIDYFDRDGIRWHDGGDRRPSNHLVSSQVACLNHLFALAEEPSALAALLAPHYPGLQEMLPVGPEPGRLIDFEWIDTANRLREPGRAQRGANVTSSDAVVRFRRADGRPETVLIEWKYTEAYGPASVAVSRSGTDRRGVYRHVLDEGAPLTLEAYERSFYQPFYQLLRLQLLTYALERAGGDREVFSVLLVVPRANAQFHGSVPPALREYGESVSAVWSRLLRRTDRFRLVHTEDLFGRPEWPRFPHLAPWLSYLERRYGFVPERGCNP